MSMMYKQPITCPECRKESEYSFWSSLNSELDPEAKQELLDGTLFTLTCPFCGFEFQVMYPMLYHDMKHSAMVYLVSEDSVEETKKVFNTNVGYIIDLPEYKKRIVTDVNSLREKAIIFENGLDDRVIEIIKLYYALYVMEKEEELNFTDILFMVEEGVYYILFMGEQDFNMEIDKDYYEKVRSRYINNISEDDKEVIIDIEWAKKVLLR